VNVLFPFLDIFTKGDRAINPDLPIFLQICVKNRPLAEKLVFIISIHIAKIETSEVGTKNAANPCNIRET
jgi:hypothetical protein